MLIGPTVTGSDINHARFKGKITHTHQTLKRVDHSDPHFPSCVLLTSCAHQNKSNVTNMVACVCCVNTKQAHSNHDKYI